VIAMTATGAPHQQYVYCVDMEFPCVMG
jgi:hypothetical protein